MESDLNFEHSHRGRSLRPATSTRALRHLIEIEVPHDIDDKRLQKTAQDRKKELEDAEEFDRKVTEFRETGTSK